MTKKFNYQFVDLIPSNIESDIIYISIKYNTAIHLCACGCGCEVVTTLSPYDWSLIFNGNSVSLYPSIGNWSLPCQSHYWIINNAVEWSSKWTQKEITFQRKQAKRNKENGRTNDWFKDLFDRE